MSLESARRGLMQVLVQRAGEYDADIRWRHAVTGFDQDVGAAMADVDVQLSVAIGRPTGELPATALLVRPDGYVAWASSQPQPDDAGLAELRSALAHLFGAG